MGKRWLSEDLNAGLCKLGEITNCEPEIVK